MKGNLIYKIFFVVICWTCINGTALFAAKASSDAEAETVPEEFVLDTIVVTASKTQESIEEIPKNVTVITREEIEKSGGKSIIDILEKQAGVTVRSASGNDKQAVIDIRGMGDTAASNVIVMVDDLPLNSADMSGPSISSVPVEQIERIEIVRGAGSVVYGSGAVGGVINIITRKNVEKTSTNLFTAYGSDNTLSTRTGLDCKVKDATLSLNAGYFDSDGYRDNGFLKKKDLTAATHYTVNDRLSFRLSGTYYEDENGLPGPVSFEDVDSRVRRVLTDYPDDSGESTEKRGRAGVDMDFGKWGELTLSRGYLFRDNSYIIGYSPQISRDDQEDTINDDSRQLDLNYVKYYSLFDHSHMFQLGADQSNTEYVREDNPSGPRKNSSTESIGVFVNNRWALTDRLMLNAGTRYNTYNGKFRTDLKKLFDDDVRIWVNGDTEKETWDNSAYSIGTTYAVTQNASVFASYATSFRIPNVDEFAESEEGLKPQEGVNIELGGRRNFGTWMVVSLSFFDIRIDDEIYYSDINRNYKNQTIRQGVETSISLNPADTIGLWGNYTFMNAEFEGTNTEIPLVPSHLASAGINWQFTEKFQLAVSGTYSGTRYDGNDTYNNRYQKLDAYTVFDTKLTWQHEGWMIFAGINNIFNELYSTSAYSEQYYPMPERNLFGGVRWTLL